MAVDDSYTVALLHMDGANASTTFTDESSKAWTASGSAQIDTANSAFGGASGLFDGAGDYLSTPNSADFDLGTANWTIDCWIKRNGTKAYPGIFGCSTNGTTGYYCGLGNSDNKVRVVWSNTVKILSAAVIADLTWTHIALFRYGTLVHLYINGIFDTAVSCAGITFNSSGSGAVIGRFTTGDNNYYWKGWIDEFRISKGIARWGTFTVPTVMYYPGGSFRATRGRGRYCGNVDPRIP